MKIRPLGAELFHAGGRRADGHDADNSRLTQFSNAPKTGLRLVKTLRLRFVSYRSYVPDLASRYFILLKPQAAKAYTDIYVNTQQLLLNTTLFYTWRHVSAAHTAFFRPAYNRTEPFMCAHYGIPHCLHIKYM